MDSSLAANYGPGLAKPVKYVGQFYILGKIAHTTLNERCTLTDEADRFPVVEVDGLTISYGSSAGGDNQVVTVCDTCGDTTADTSWMDEAACRDTLDDRFFDSRRYPRAVTKFCAKCPVALECLEYGAKRDRDNIGSTWGGVYFTKVNEVRRTAIKEQRAALLRGESPKGAVSREREAKPPCTKPSCEKPVLARKMCSMHYNELWKAGAFK